MEAGASRRVSRLRVLLARPEASCRDEQFLRGDRWAGWAGLRAAALLLERERRNRAHVAIWTCRTRDDHLSTQFCSTGGA